MSTKDLLETTLVTAALTIGIIIGRLSQRSEEVHHHHYDHHHYHGNNTLNIQNVSNTNDTTFNIQNVSNTNGTVNLVGNVNYQDSETSESTDSEFEEDSELSKY